MKTVQQAFKYDMTKEGYLLVEDVPFSGRRFIPEMVRLVMPGETSVGYEEMRRRAKEFNANLGQAHAELLLRNQKKLIPDEWRNYCFPFPGTVWEYEGYPSISILRWCHDQKQWKLHCSLIKSEWGADVCLVRCGRQL